MDLKHKRFTRDEVFMGVAWLFAKRSTCLRGQVGAVAILDNRIISTGYNGSPSGQEHCTVENGCSSEATSCPNAIHAEANLIAFAAKSGVSLNGAILYCTHEPCIKCAQLIIQAGIKKVYYDKEYTNHDGRDLLFKSQVLIHRYEK